MRTHRNGTITGAMLSMSSSTEAPMRDVDLSPQQNSGGGGDLSPLVTGMNPPSGHRGLPMVMPLLEDGYNADSFYPNGFETTIYATAPPSVTARAQDGNAATSTSHVPDAGGVSMLDLPEMLTPSASFKKPSRVKLSLDLEAAEPVRQQARNCLSPMAGDMLLGSSLMQSTSQRFPHGTSMADEHSPKHPNGGEAAATSTPHLLDGSAFRLSLPDMVPPNTNTAGTCGLVLTSPFLGGLSFSGGNNVLRQQTQEPTTCDYSLGHFPAFTTGGQGTNTTNTATSSGHPTPNCNASPPSGHSSSPTHRTLIATRTVSSSGLNLVDLLEDSMLGGNSPFSLNRGQVNRGGSALSVAGGWGSLTSHHIAAMSPQHTQALRTSTAATPVAAASAPQSTLLGNPESTWGRVATPTHQRTRSSLQSSPTPTPTVVDARFQAVVPPPVGNPLSSAGNSPQLPTMLPPTRTLYQHTVDFDLASDDTLGGGGSLSTAAAAPSHSSLAMVGPVSSMLIQRCTSLPPAALGLHGSMHLSTNNASLSGWPALGAASPPSSMSTFHQPRLVPMPIDADPSDIIHLGTPLFSTMGALANNASFDLLNTASYRLVHDGFLGSGNGGTVRRVRRVPVVYGYVCGGSPAAAPNNDEFAGNTEDAAVNRLEPFNVRDGFDSLLPSPSCGQQNTLARPLGDWHHPAPPGVPSPHHTTTDETSSSRNNGGCNTANIHCSQESSPSLLSGPVTGIPADGSSPSSAPFKSPPSPVNNSASDDADSDGQLRTQPATASGASAERTTPVTAALDGILRAGRKRRDRRLPCPTMRRETMQCVLTSPTDLAPTIPSAGNGSSSSSRNPTPTPLTTTTTTTTTAHSSRGDVIDTENCSPPTVLGRRTTEHPPPALRTSSTHSSHRHRTTSFVHLDELPSNASFMSVASAVATPMTATVRRRSLVALSQGGPQSEPSTGGFKHHQQNGRSNNYFSNGEELQSTGCGGGLGGSNCKPDPSGTPHHHHAGEVNRVASARAYSQGRLGLATASSGRSQSGSFFSLTASTPGVQHVVPSGVAPVPPHQSINATTATTPTPPTYFALKEINLNSQERVAEIQRELKNLVASHRYYYYPTDPNEGETSPRYRRKRSSRRRREASSSKGSFGGEGSSFLTAKGNPQSPLPPQQVAGGAANGSSSTTTNATGHGESTSPVSALLSPQQRALQRRTGGFSSRSFGSASNLYAAVPPSNQCDRNNSSVSQFYSGFGGRSPASNGLPQRESYVPYPVSCSHVVDYFGAFQHENTIVIVMELMENSVESLLKAHLRGRHAATHNGRAREEVALTPQTDISSPITAAPTSTSMSLSATPQTTCFAESAEGSPTTVMGRPPLFPLSTPTVQVPDTDVALPSLLGIPLRYVSLIARDVLRGLLFLHKVRTLVHRDLKPANLLYTTDPTASTRRVSAGSPHSSPRRSGTYLQGSNSTIHSNNTSATLLAPAALIKIADFGVSHEFTAAVDETHQGDGGAAERESGAQQVGYEDGPGGGSGEEERGTDQEVTTRAFIGSISYMSPERLRNDPYGYPSDIWSLGLLLLEIATGKHPYADALTKNGTRPVGGLRQEERFWAILGHLGRPDSWSRPTSEQAVASSSSTSSCDGAPGGAGERRSHLALPSEIAESCPVFADFLQLALAKLPEGRGTAGELLRHPFILMHCAHERSVLTEIGSLFVDELGEFTRRTGLHATRLVPGLAQAFPSSLISTPRHAALIPTHKRTASSNQPDCMEGSASGGAMPFAFASRGGRPSCTSYGPLVASVFEDSMERGGGSFFSPTRSHSITGCVEVRPQTTMVAEEPSPERNDVQRAKSSTDVGHTLAATSSSMTPAASTFVEVGPIDAASRRRSSVLFSPSGFSFHSTPGGFGVSHGMSNDNIQNPASDFTLDSTHRLSIESQAGLSLFIRRRTASSATTRETPYSGDLAGTPHSDSCVPQPHRRPSSPQQQDLLDFTPSLHNRDSSSNTSTTNRQLALAATRHFEGGADDLVQAAFRETMEPSEVGDHNIRIRAQQRLRQLDVDADDDVPQFQFATNLRTSHVDPTDDATKLDNALRVRNVMVSLLSGSYHVEVSERQELAQYMRCTVAST